MAQTDILLTKEPAPQTVPACQLPRKLYDVARNTGAHTSSGLATSGFRTAKYLLDEWFQNCYARYHQAFADRDQSERQRHESQQLAAETEALAQRTQQDSTRKVGGRLQDTHGWKSELQRQVEELVSETEQLLAQKQRLERALDATAGPFSIVTDNLQCRDRRQHPDLVRDCVEIELLKVRLPSPWSRRPASHLSPGSTTFPVFPPRLGCAEPGAWAPLGACTLPTWGHSSTRPGTEGWGARTNWSWGLPSWGQGQNSGSLGGGGRVPVLAFPRPGSHSGCWARLSSLQVGPVRPCWVRGIVAWVPPCTGAGLEPSACPLACSTPALTRGEAGPRPWWHSSPNVCRDDAGLRQGRARPPGNQEGPELGPRGGWLGLECVQAKGDPPGQVVVAPVPPGWPLSHPWGPAPVDLPLWSPWVMQMKPDPEFTEAEPCHTPTLPMSALEIQPQAGVQVWTVKVGWRPRASHRDPAGPVLGAALKDWGSPRPGP